MSDIYAEGDVWPTPARPATVSPNQPVKARGNVGDADGAREALVGRIAEAIVDAALDAAQSGWAGQTNTATLYARAVVPVVAAEVEAATATLRRDALAEADAYRAMFARAEAAESTLRQVRELHFAYTIYEPCEHQFTGCGADACTENPHDGEWFHSDQPVGKACGECNDEEGLFVEWPCPTVRILDSARVGAADTEPEGAGE